MEAAMEAGLQGVVPRPIATIENDKATGKLWIFENKGGWKARGKGKRYTIGIGRKTNLCRDGSHAAKTEIAGIGRAGAIRRRAGAGQILRAGCAGRTAGIIRKQLVHQWTVISRCNSLEGVEE